MKLFSGSAHRKLSTEVSQFVGIQLSYAEITRFGNSEVKVTIKESVKDDICVVLQPTSNPADTNIMELAFFCDALKREEARHVIGVIPYFGYAKQNIQHRPGESVSAHVVVRFFESIGFSKIYTFDLHDEATAGVFSIPFRNLSALPLLAEKIRVVLDPQSVILVSPDQGAVEKVRNFGKTFYQTDSFHEAVIEKDRDQNQPHQAKPLDLYGNVKGKIALIVDDMVVSGSTLIPAAKLCLEKGAQKVYAAVVHHDFTSDAPQLIQASPVERFFTTNTIPLGDDQKFTKLEEISVAKMIAEELKRISVL